MTIKSRSMILLISILLVSFTLQGCQPAAEEDSVPTPEVTEMPEPTTPPARPQRLSTDGQIQAAREDLAQRLDVDISEISAVESAPVTWRTSALGCPEPGMMYTQALTPGFRVILQVGDSTYNYHARTSGQPFHCPDERTETPAPGQNYE